MIYSRADPLRIRDRVAPASGPQGLPVAYAPEQSKAETETGTGTETETETETETGGHGGGEHGGYWTGRRAGHEGTRGATRRDREAWGDTVRDVGHLGTHTRCITLQGNPIAQPLLEGAGLLLERRGTGQLGQHHQRLIGSVTPAYGLWRPLGPAKRFLPPERGANHAG